MNAKAINAVVPLLLAAGAIACFVTGRTEAGSALLAAVAAHLLPSPIPPKDGAQ
jgi:hypothetical protein